MRIPSHTLLATALLAGCASSGAPGRTVPSDSTRLRLDVGWLAADAREGRGTGTAGDDSTRRWIVKRMQALGLEPVFPPSACVSACRAAYEQPFDAKMSGAERNGLPAVLRTGNVAGIIRGSDPALRDQYVVIGAHLDHLGRRTFGARDPSAGDAIRNGADDNASGVATVLELARLIKRNPLRRSVVVATFSGEELGLLGSQYLVDHAPIPLDAIQAMLNFDMVGRLRDDRLMVYGTATALEFPAIVTGANVAPPFKLNAVGDGEGPSDHASFYHKNVPVLHFFTDVHNDYHTSTDDADKINTAGMARVVAYAERIVRDVGDRAQRLTFTRAPVAASRTGSATRTGGPQPSLGTIPDMGASDIPGLRLGGVSPGGVGEKAGLRAGDVIVEFDGQPVIDLQSYSDALYSKKPGDEVLVVVLRGSERLTFKVRLGQRGG